MQWISKIPPISPKTASFVQSYRRRPTGSRSSGWRLLRKAPSPPLALIWFEKYTAVWCIQYFAKKYTKKYLLCHLSNALSMIVIEDIGYNQTRKDQNQKWKELNQELTTWELGRKRQLAWKTKVIKKKNVPPAFPQQDLTNSFCKNRPTRKALRGPEM